MISEEQIKILEFLKSKPRSSVKTVEQKFKKNNNIKTLMYYLELDGLIEEYRKPCDDRFYGKHTYTYFLTSLGEIVLKEHTPSIKARIKKYVLYFIIPVLGFVISVLQYTDPNSVFFKNLKEWLIGLF